MRVPTMSSAVFLLSLEGPRALPSPCSDGGRVPDEGDPARPSLGPGGAPSARIPRLGDCLSYVSLLPASRAGGALNYFVHITRTYENTCIYSCQEKDCVYRAGRCRGSR